jgi:hypothetical protein
MRDVNPWDFSDISVLCRNGRRSVLFSKWKLYDDNDYFIPAKSNNVHQGVFFGFLLGLTRTNMRTFLWQS